MNNNGRKLIELCKISDLKIVNGRVGRDKHIWNYTCYTSRGKSTIDYAVVSMDVFSSIDDFYIYVSDKCMSNLHCPICLTISCNKTVSNENQYIRADKTATILLRQMLSVDGKTISEMIIRQHSILITFKE